MSWEDTDSDDKNEIFYNVHRIRTVKELEIELERTKEKLRIATNCLKTITETRSIGAGFHVQISLLALDDIEKVGK